jgi:hypothetical protein
LSAARESARCSPARATATATIVHRDDRRRQVAEVDPQSDYRERPKDFTFRDASPQEAYA